MTSGSDAGLDDGAVLTALPVAVLVMDRRLVIREANAAYLALTGRTRAEVLGRDVFDAFPENPDGVGQVEGPASLRASLQRVLSTRAPHAMPLLKYDVESEPGSGVFEERWWSVVNSPILTSEGAVRGVVQSVDEVTSAVRARDLGRHYRELAEDLRARTADLEADLTDRAQQLRTLGAAEARTARRLTSLAEATLELGTAETVEEFADVAHERGLAALGADYLAVGVVDGDSLELLTDLMPDPRVPERVVRLPLDGPLPSSVAAATGRRVLLGDPATARRWSAAMSDVLASTDRQAWAALPLAAEGRVLGSVTVAWDQPQPFTDEEVELLAAFAAQCAQALHRLQVRDAERQVATETRRFSEALQRSLLTDPPQPDHLQLAVRYLPAVEEAQVGGDWYDAFMLPDGATVLVVGDVAGHDRNAAATMAQVRNVLRGVAQTLEKPPAAVLSALDRTLRDLAVDGLVTAVLGRIEQVERVADRGTRVLRWSNAGHPPPLLIDGDGAAALLQRDPDLLLGLDPGTARTDHEQVLDPGATLLLYTDGLVERRGASLDEGLDWLVATATRLAPLPLEEFCTRLLGEQSDATDDIALLAVRAHPEDRARPPEAGPEVVPG